MNQYTYDLDSLVYMSPQIVEGTLGAESSTNHVTVSGFKISAVLKGRLKVGQTIQVTALDFYVAAEKGFYNYRKLRSGDQFFLFGDRAKKTFLYHIPDDAEIYWPAPSGVWLIVGNKALDFWQESNPGPYIAVLRGAATNTAVPTVAELRKRIHESMRRVEAWRPLLERSATIKDVPELLEILREEKAAEHEGKGPYGYLSPHSITDMACDRLVSLRDVSALTNALNINGKLIGKLGFGFDSPSGRSFLWSKITDEKVSMRKRIKWAGILWEAGEGNPGEHHLKRIAKYAVRPHQNEKLRAILLDSLQQMQKWWRFTHGGKGPDATIRDDVDAATLVLTSFAKKTDSEELKHQIDLILEEFNGEKPTLISILSFDSYDASTRQLKYHYDISRWKSTNMTTRIVFQSVKTGSRWELPADLNLKPVYSGNSGGIKDITVPSDLPDGRYRVFYEFLHNGKVSFTSRYFETDL